MSNRNYESNIVKNFSDLNLDLNLDSDQKNDTIKPISDEFEFESESQKEFSNKDISKNISKNQFLGMIRRSREAKNKDKGLNSDNNIEDGQDDIESGYQK